MGYGQGLSPEEVRRKRAETKKRWRERNPEKWRAMRAAQKQRYLDRKRGPGRTRRALLAAMTKAERAAYDREKRLKAEYGLTAEQYDAMVEAQGGLCAICGQVEDGKPLVVDHCHDSGRVRGLLCNACNAGLGFMRDSQRSLLRAVEYLRANELDTWGLGRCEESFSLPFS